MSLPQKTTSSNQYSGSSFNPNLLRSLTSVHLPPPPSSRGHPVLSKNSNSNNNVKTHGKSASFDGNAYSSVYNTPWSGGNTNGHGHGSSLMSLDHIGGDGSHTFESSPLDTKSGGIGVGADSNSNLYYRKLSDITEPMLNTPPASQQRFTHQYSGSASSHTLHMSATHASNRHEYNKQDMYETPTLSGARSGRYKKDSDKENLAASSSYYESSTMPSDRGFNQHIQKIHNNSQTSSSNATSPAYNNASELMNGKYKMLKIGEDELDAIPDPEDMPKVVDDGKKPPYSYASLIGMAILRSPERKLTLSQIYQWINDTFEWYRKSASGWQNSIRHNLSLNKAFQKQERPKGDPGKGNYWLVVPGCEHQFVKQKPVRKSGLTPAASRTQSQNMNNKPMQLREDDLHDMHLGHPNPSAIGGNGLISARDALNNLSVVQQQRQSHKGQSTDDDNNYDEYDEDDDAESGSEAGDSHHHANVITSITGLGGDAATQAKTLMYNKRTRDSINDIDFDDPLSTPVLLKRTKTAIGLQHFSTTNVYAISPTKNNNGGTDLLLTSKTTPRKGSHETLSPASTPLTSVAHKQQPHVNSSYHHKLGTVGGAGLLDPDEIPDLSAPASTWLPYTTNDETLSSGMNTSLDPSLVKFNSSILSSTSHGTTSTGVGRHDGLLSELPSSVLMSPGTLSSPSTSLRNHRAAMRTMTVPLHEYEDITTSPSAGLGKRRSLVMEDDDVISRACFGSPDKREARRRQYFESSGVSRFGLDDTLADVFGVDICQVVRRELKHKQHTPTSSFGSNIINTEKDKEKEKDQTDSNSNSNSNSTGNEVDNTRKDSVIEALKADGFGLSLFDSPIKTDINISPPKISRRDSAYF